MIIILTPFLWSKIHLLVEKAVFDTLDLLLILFRLLCLVYISICY